MNDNIVKLTPFFDSNDKLLLNTLYLPPVYENENGRMKRVRDDVLYIVYRDLLTREKKLLTVDKPEVDIFFASDEMRGRFQTQRQFLDACNCKMEHVPYSKITAAIRREVRESEDKKLDEIYTNSPKESLRWRYSMFADFNICDYVQIAYLLNHDAFLETGNIGRYDVSKAYFDIESDIYGLTTEESDEGYGPINAVSVVVPYDERAVRYEHPHVYTFLLRNYKRYKEQEYMETHMDKFIAQCHEEFDDKYNSPIFHISFYDSEIDLLQHLFAMLHKKSPDICEIWNMSYDIPKIQRRLELLGETPELYFGHPDFKTQFIRYNYDHVFINDFKNKNESFDCTSYTIWHDDMLQYAGIRKSSADYGSNKLDNIAHIELKAEKRRYSKKSVNVLNGAIEEYWNFALYSINDTLLQYGIDEKTGDTNALFDQSLYGGTRLSKTLKQSVYLKNVWALEYFMRGLVPGNNINIDYNKNASSESATDIELYEAIRSVGEVDDDGEITYDEESLAGALVGDPLLNDKCGVKIFGEYSNRLFAFVADMDYSSEYPNAKIAMNAAPCSQYGRLIIENEVFKGENPDNNPKFIRGGKFIEDYESDDLHSVGRWFHLPSSCDLINKYVNTVKAPVSDTIKRDADGYILIEANKYAMMRSEESK